MSASTKKKLRKEERMAQMTERQKKEKAEAKKLKRYTILGVSALVIVIVAAILIAQYNWVTNPHNIDAMTVGDHDVSVVEMQYYYMDSVSNFISQMETDYGENASLMLMLYGLDVSTPLDEQYYNEEMTWADYFMDMAMESAKSDYIMYDMANQEGFVPSDEEMATLDTIIATNQLYATSGNFPTLTDYLVQKYGLGSTEDTYRTYVHRSLTANAYFNAHSDSLTFDQAALDAYEAEHTNEFSSYDYASCYLSYSDFLTGGTTDEDGTTTHTDEEKEAARAAAKAAAEELAKAENLLQLDKAYSALLAELEATETTTEETETTEPTTEDTEATEATESTETTEATEATTEATEATTEATEATTEATEATTEATEATTEATEATTEATEATEATETTESEDEHDHDHEDEESSTSLDSYTRHNYTEITETIREWVTDSSRQKDDIEVIVSETTVGEGEEATTTINGYYVVCFQNRDDNNALMGNVHHILIAPEEVEGEDGKTSTTDATWNTAKETAEMFLKTWKEAGDTTLESFETMAAELVDEGSAQEHGLFENVNPDSNYVENFRNWALDPDRVAGETDVIKTEHGYHIMFYVGASEQTERQLLVETALHNETLQNWYDEALASVSFSKGDISSMDLGLTLG